MSFYAQTERMDFAVDTDRFVYIFEFKIDRSAGEAIAQIRERRNWTK